MENFVLSRMVYLVLFGEIHLGSTYICINHMSTHKIYEWVTHHKQNGLQKLEMVIIVKRKQL